MKRHLKGSCFSVEQLRALLEVEKALTSLENPGLRFEVQRAIKAGEVRLSAIRQEREKFPKRSIIVDLFAAPFVPKDLSIVEHRPGDKKFEWNPKKVALFLAEGQQISQIKGDTLREVLKGKPVFNANLLDFLLKNPHLIPEDWKGKAVFFWGTLYCNASGILYVRFLYWDGKVWDWSYHWLGNSWLSSNPAAVHAEIAKAA